MLKSASIGRSGNGPRRPQIQAPAVLPNLLLDRGWADTLGAQCLVVDVGSQHEGPVPSGVLDWLAALPVPSIGVAFDGSGPLAEGMDIVVESEENLDAVLARIRANPTASSVLVHVLRSTVKLPVLDALAVESLGYATLQSGQEFARWLAGRNRGEPKSSGATWSDAVLLDRSESRLQIVLNATHNRNALSTTMRDGLTEAFRFVAMEPGIERVDVRANGSSFSSGGDLTEFGTTTDPSEAHGIRMQRMPARYLAPEAHRYHFHVHGACIGAGIELAAFAGRLTAAPDAFFQLPEVVMGLIPGAGGCVSIPRRIGRQRTAYMALTNQRIDAEQALAWGLLDALEAGG